MGDLATEYTELHQGGETWKTIGLSAERYGGVFILLHNRRAECKSVLSDTNI
jgi:hypothetical protein